MVGGRQTSTCLAAAQRDDRTAVSAESPKEGSSDREECNGYVGVEQTERSGCVLQRPSECVEQVENGAVPRMEREDNTSGAMRSKWARSRQIAVSYAKMFLFGVGYGLTALVYWIVTSVSTSYNADLGFVSLSSFFIAMGIFLILGPAIVTLVGAKACFLGTALGGLVLSLTYFYPSWYTVLPAAILWGTLYAPIFPSAGVFMEGEAHRCVDKAGVDLVTYRGRFSAMYMFFDGAGSILAGVTITTILFIQGDADATGAGSTAVNLTLTQAPNTSSDAHTLACRDLPLSRVSLPAGSTNYYIIIAACTAASVLAVIVVSVLKTPRKYGCRVCAFGLKGALRHMAVHSVKVLKQMSTPPFVLLAPTPVHIGLSTGFFFGTFTKKFITDCIGAKYVGVSTCVWGLCNAVGAIGGGWLLAWVPSSVLFLAVTLGETACLLFLLVWERTQSLAVVLIFAVSFGLVYGSELGISNVYAGVVPAKNREIGYSIVFIWYSVGHMVEYFISPYISLEANILLILAMTVVAVSQFSMADYYFGSASSAKCWGWCKRPAAGLGEGEAQQANGGEMQVQGDVQGDAVSIISTQ